MQIRISITIDEMETIDLLTTERGELQAGNLGFSLAEAKSLLANGQKTVINAQAAMHAQNLKCAMCAESLRRNGRNTIVVRTLFGKVPIDSPRFYRCTCTSEASFRASFSPLAELLPERTVPELQYLQVKWAASMSYGLTLEILRDVFPIGDALGKEGIRNNVARVALQAMAAVLGGTQSLHTNSLDETYALPTEQAVTIALRTQQIVAHETGAANTIDPLGGSYYVEWLTNRLEQEALAYIEKIDQLGGMVEAIERGFPQREIAESSYRFQQSVERGEKTIVGVNDFVQADEPPIEILYIDESAADTQLAKLAKLRETRDHGAVSRSLDALRAAARTTENLMPRILDAVRAYATVGEMCDALRDVWGEYEEVPII